MDSTLSTKTSDIANHLRTLHSLVTTALQQAMDAFEDLDVELAREAGAVTDQVEHLHHLIEDFVFESVSLHQPKGIDLRRLISKQHVK